METFTPGSGQQMGVSTIKKLMASASSDWHYSKRFKKEQPDRIISLEEQAQEMQRKKEEKKARHLARQVEEELAD